MVFKNNEQRQLSRKEQIGQCLHPAAYIHDTPEGIAEIEQYISEYKIGGLTFFYSRESVETNFNRKKVFEQKEDSIEKLFELVNHYQKLSEVPLLISIDAEWGLGMRIASHPPFPYPMTLSATDDSNDCFEVGKAIGKELKSVGIHLNLAPVADININPNNPVIGYRSFGTNPQTVFENAKAFYKGMKSEGILGCLKHFPGHGDTQTDSHLALPVIDKTLEELHVNELFPFKKIIEFGVDCVMTGHIQIPALDDSSSSSLSHKIIQNILRQEFQFNGAVITDALNMKSVVQFEERGESECKAFLAGNDILSFSKNTPEAIKIIDEKVPEEKVEASFQRIMALKEKVNILGTLNTPLSVPNSSALRSNIAQKTITIVKPSKENFTLQTILFFNKTIESSHFKPIDNCTYYEWKKVMGKGNFSFSNNLLIAVYPPSYKPIQNFGFDESILEEIHKLAKTNTVDLCLFGNPYSLKLFELECFNSVIVAYQDLPEFEQAAAKYFSGRIQAIGKLPFLL